MAAVASNAHPATTTAAITRPTATMPTATATPDAPATGATTVPAQTIVSKAPVTQADIEAMTGGDANFSKELQRIRQGLFSLDGEKMQAFLEMCECVSLGCYCGISTAFQGLGIRKAAYPFDWTRSSVESVIHCFENEFEDFLTYTKQRDDHGNHGYVSARWGGSFWHHNPSDPKTKAEFTRRIQRLLGLGKVPPETPRIFVRAVNSTGELNASVRLLETLKQALPDAKVRLLMLIDLQDEKGAFKLPSHDDLLFYRIHKSLFDEPRGIHKCIEPYGEALAFALRTWAGDETVLSATVVKTMKHLQAACQQWDGGSPACELFNPLPYQGQPVVLRPASVPATVSAPLPSLLVSPSTPSPIKGDAKFETLSSPAMLNHARRASTPAFRRSLSGSAKDRNLTPQGRRHSVGTSSVPLASPQHQRFASLSLPASASGAALRAPSKDAAGSGAVTSPGSHSGPPSPTPSVPMPAAPPVHREEVGVQRAELRLPADAKAGDVVHTDAFGQRWRVEVPKEATGGQLLQLRFAEGVLTFALAAAMTTASSAALTQTLASNPSCRDLQSPTVPRVNEPRLRA